MKGPKFDGMLDRFWSIWGAHFESNSVPERVQNGVQIEVEKRRVTKTVKKVVTPLQGRLEEGPRKAQGRPEEGSRPNQGPPREKIIRIEDRGSRIKDRVKDLTRWARPGEYMCVCNSDIENHKNN